MCSCQSNFRKGETIMREKIKITEGIFPMPVLMVATYNDDGTVDVMNAAWGMMQERDTVALNLTETHKTVKNIKARGAFTVSMATEDMEAACDYVGIESGRKVADKFARAGFTAVKSEYVDAPLIAELPLALECRVKSFEDGILVGEIVNVCADESILTDGKVDVKKLRPISFDPFANAYFGVGEKVGDAFRDGMRLK